MNCRFTVVFAPLPAEMKAEWRVAIETLAMWLEEESPHPGLPPNRESTDLGEGESPGNAQIADDNSGAAGEAGRSPSDKG